MKLPINYNKSNSTLRRAVREEYIRLQKGICSHCGIPLNEDPPEEITRLKVNKSLFPKDFFKWSVHLHHDHNTGMTIGAIHNYCNAVLWQYYGE
jgi:hypothetical protein